ncbi:MAG: GNAT family N-acetyltransferase [Candidatus Bathyarchaeota archaeon]|jgi:RimJ/RimL family protein N-acetyltransferase|nr:GNAT family N-acetyltransferase [Candidatus Bathyarchaeota archaeon]
MFEFGKLRFRPIEREDLKLLHEWENDFELIMYSRSKPMNFVNTAQLEKQYDEWVKDEKELRFMVELIDSEDPIGIARLRREEWGNVKTADVGTYIGKKELWGKGFGRQIIVALLEMSFNQLNMERSEAWSVEYNHRAHKALEACGFKRGGVVRQAAFVNGRKWDGYHFDILREEYLNTRMGLLKQMLGDKAEEYAEKHCTIKGY